MNPQLLQETLAAVRGLQPGNTKKAFVPGPSVQGQLQRLQAIAAEQQSDAVAASQASEQIQAQAQGAPPAMRIEDLAAMLDQGFQGLAQLISTQFQQLQQILATQAQQPAAQAGGGTSGGSGGEKKPKKEDVLASKLDELINLMRGAMGAPAPAPPGAAGSMPPPEGAPPPGGAPPPMAGAPQAPPMQ